MKHHNKLFHGAATLLSASLIFSPLSYAQSAVVEDEVVATGTLRGADPAMGAFFSGDYATAEVEFEKNFRRIKRSEMPRNRSRPRKT